MSEGKYGRLPQPKGGVRVAIGKLKLEPAHDKAAEWEEEDDVLMPRPKAKPAESMLAKVGRVAGELGAAVSKPWSRFTGEDDDEHR